MREIKVRAWNTRTKGMGVPKTLNDMIELAHRGHEIIITELKNIIWLEYTGLKDKNGKEAYHKDIVLRGGVKFVVEWHDNLASWYLEPISGVWHGINGSDMALMCEVIGNIYSNKELIE